MSIFVVNSGLGNFGAVVSILRRIGQSSALIDRPVRVDPSDRIILPGVGAFDAGVRALRDRGLDDFVRDSAAQGVPLLGICLGMQLLCRESEEGSLPGLGLIPAAVRRIDPGPGERVPHMGWTEVRPTRPSTLFGPAHDEPQRFYFVHSYHVVCDEPADVTAVAAYGGEITCAFERAHLRGVQFHPEKSHRYGMGLLRRFVAP